MANIQHLIADSLDELRKLQEVNSHVVIKGTEQLSRTHLKRLLDNGWLMEVLKGWYVPSRPGSEGDTSVWYTSYWHFIRAYAQSRYGIKWCLSAEMSLDFHSGKTTVPRKLILKSPDAANNVISLLYDHSLLNLQASLPENIITDPIYGLNLYSLEAALIYASPSYYTNDPMSAKVCLGMIERADELLKIIAEKGATTRAGRIIGALRSIGNDKVADEILSTMKEFGYTIKVENPFLEAADSMDFKSKSPYVARLRLMWNDMRSQVIDNFPMLSRNIEDVNNYINDVDEKYLEDAYHSLSIEGYKVSHELIEKIRHGNWNPDGEDKDHKSALVARGYYQAFQVVKDSIRKILEGDNSGRVVDEYHSKWYRQMWMPFVTAGILSPSDIIGYRTSQVYIRKSRHIPLNPKAVADTMQTLFELLENESDARVRAVLGHFMFVFIHPYMDGNGRMGRFILNAMLASGGYPWTIVPSERRREYMEALEKASVEGDISDFTRFIVSLIPMADS